MITEEKEADPSWEKLPYLEHEEILSPQSQLQEKQDQIVWKKLFPPSSSLPQAEEATGAHFTL